MQGQIIPCISDFLLSIIKELNNQLKSGIKATATINKYGRNGLDDAITDIARLNNKVYR